MLRWVFYISLIAYLVQHIYIVNLTSLAAVGLGQVKMKKKKQSSFFFVSFKTCAPPNLARVLTGQGGGGFRRYLCRKVVSNASVGHNFTAQLASIIQTSIYQTKRLEQQKINQNFFLKKYQKQTRQSKKIYFFCFF